MAFLGGLGFTHPGERAGVGLRTLASFARASTVVMKIEVRVRAKRPPQRLMSLPTLGIVRLAENDARLALTACLFGGRPCSLASRAVLGGVISEFGEGPRRRGGRGRPRARPLLWPNRRFGGSLRGLVHRRHVGFRLRLDLHLWPRLYLRRPVGPHDRRWSGHISHGVHGVHGVHGAARFARPRREGKPQPERETEQ